MNSKNFERIPLSTKYGPAWLVVRPDRGPMRPIATGRRHRPVGEFFSVKSGRHLPYESGPELHSLLRAEASTQVVESWVQPFRLEFAHHGPLLSYTPDRQDLMADGVSEILEIKDEVKPQEQPFYYAKLMIASEILLEQGLRFRIQERKEIEAEPSFTAIRTIVRYARTEVSPADLAKLSLAFATRTSISFVEVQMLLGGGQHGLAATCALIVRRVIAVNPQFSFEPDVQVSLLSAGEFVD